MNMLLERIRGWERIQPARLRPSLNLALWLLAFALVRLASQQGWVAPVELAVSDGWHQLAGPREPVRQVALVVVDEAALAAYQDDPLVFWTPQMAQASARLRELGAPVVGLDLLFSLSAEKWLNRAYGGSGHARYDAAFRREIALGKLVLVAASQTRADDRPGFLLPATDYVLALPGLDMANHVGLADLTTDVDGVVRRHAVSVPGAGEEQVLLPRWSFAALLARRAGAKRISEDTTPRAIPFLGPPGHVPRVSLATLLAPDALQRPEVQALKGRVVIIGGEYAGMNDVHPTPYSSGFFGGGVGDMSGPELQANIAEALLSGRTLDALPGLLEGLLQALALLAALALFQWAGLGMALLALPGLLAVSLLGAYGLFPAGWLFPVAALGFALMALFLAVLGLRYVMEEQERLRITGLFGRYVSRQVVDQLIASGETPSLGGVRREVTVLFSDIRDFTTLSERLEAEEVVEMLNRYFGQVCTAIQRHGGTIDKFIGDAVMVQFGAPLPYADHADRALRAALEIRAIAREFRLWMGQRFRGRDLPEFAVGIGLHSGPVVVGNIGSAQRMEYTAIGDTVNVASRIEGMTKALGAVILASPTTLAAACLPLSLGQSREMPLKGKAEPMVLTEVLAIQAG